MDQNNLSCIRDEIISCALPHVPFDGWGDAALARGAQDAGYDSALVRAAFPGGVSDAVAGFSDLADRAMLAALQDVSIDDLRVRDRVRTALMARYVFLEPHREALRQALCFWALPQRKARGIKSLWRTADRIWDWAGDVSKDYNRYTKRGLLSGVIASTTLAWLDEREKNRGTDMEHLQAFLDRRLENVMKFGKFLGQIRKAS
ncbi:MAG: COQ9 family protein [Alphaproteobacteria bacterium]|nr:COQ9 family protein [Alphaproteobacteria bacterium]